MDKLKRLKLLLGKGFLPENMPPPFHTRDLAKFAGALSKAFVHPLKPPKTRYQRYSIARLGDSRRNLAIVNPVAQFYLSKEIADNWIKIRAFLKKTSMSITSPDLTDGDEHERSILTTDFSALDFRKLEISSAHDYVLFSDISRFYPTLYTHVIPWALNGKQWSKVNLNTAAYKNTLGSRLDAFVRRTQEDQTIGIPIGPDTSRILSEIVAVGAEEQLYHLLSRRLEGAARHVDDMTIGASTLAEAEQIRFCLERSLDFYELQINPDKTRITTSASFHEATWPYEIKKFEFGASLSEQRVAIEHFFHRAFELSEKHRKDNVLNYAIKRSKSIIVYKRNWPLYETFLIKAARSNGTCLPTVVQIFASYRRLGYALNEAALHKFISDSISRHAPVGHHGELAWTLFLAKAVGITIPKKAVAPVYDVDCSACSLLALDLDSMGRIEGGLDKSRWAALLTLDNLNSDMWLLAYEADLKGWLNAPTPGFVNAHDHFSHLRKHKISFYDTTKNVMSIKKEKKLFWAHFKQEFARALASSASG